MNRVDNSLENSLENRFLTAIGEYGQIIIATRNAVANSRHKLDEASEKEKREVLDILNYEMRRWIGELLSQGKSNELSLIGSAEKVLCSTTYAQAGKADQVEVLEFCEKVFEVLEKIEKSFGSGIEITKKGN